MITLSASPNYLKLDVGVQKHFTATREMSEQVSQVSWVNTDPSLWESQVGTGQWGMPLISREVFGDTDLHYPTVNSSLPLSEVGQSLTLYDTGFRTFTSSTEGDIVETVRNQAVNKSKIPLAEMHAKFAEDRELGFRKSSMLFRVDVGTKMAMADVEWNHGDTEHVEDTNFATFRIMAHAKGNELIIENVAPQDPSLDPAYATTRDVFDKSLPSLHHVKQHDFKREITQVLFDNLAGTGKLATRLLVRTTGATHVVDLNANVQELFTSMVSTSYFDLRDDKYVDCDLQGDLYAGATADGTWRIHQLGTEPEAHPPIIAQGYDPRFEVLSDWKSIKLFDGGKKMALASRKGLRLYAMNKEDMGAEPTFVELFQQQHAGDVIMDMKRDPKYPNLLVVLSAVRMMIFDLNKDTPLQISRTMNLLSEDASIKLSMSLVEGKSIAIVHSQLSLQKIFYTYAYQNPAEPLLLEWTCDPYPIMLSTQTPINSTLLVEFPGAIDMLFDCDIDGCVVRKLLTSEPSKFQDYKPDPVWKFPGQYKNGKEQNVRVFSFEGYDEFMLPPPFPEPIGVSEIAGKLDGLIKTWHKEGCPGGRTSLAQLGADDTPSSIDEFGEMLGELQKHYSTSAVRIFPNVDPVKKYEELMSVYVTPSTDTSDRGNPLLGKYLIEYRIKTERMCRRLAATLCYLTCSVRRSKEDRGKEKDVPVHITKMLDDWVIGAPPKTNYDDWVEFGTRKNKRKAPTQQELLSQIVASRNTIPTLSLSSQAPSQRASLAPSSSHRSSLARVASQDTRRQSAGPSGSQGGSQKRSKRRKTLGGFR